MVGADSANRRLEATPDPVALHRLADLARDGEAEARPALIGCARACLAAARPWPRGRTPASPSARRCAPAGTLRAASKSSRPASRSFLVQPVLWPLPIRRRRKRSRRQALAALGAPPGHDRAAARGRHALAEPMPPLAHEPARLIGPFHFSSPSLASPCRGCAVARRQRGAAMAQPAERHSRPGRRSNWRAYRVVGSPSQSEGELTSAASTASILGNPWQTINSFRFPSRVLDSGRKYRCQRLFSRPVSPHATRTAPHAPSPPMSDKKPSSRAPGAQRRLRAGRCSAPPAWPRDAAARIAA